MKDKIKEILSDIFGVSSDEFNANSILADFEAWDSLTHMELIVTIEKACNFEMTFDEIASIKSVKDLYKILEGKKI